MHCLPLIRACCPGFVFSAAFRRCRQNKRRWQTSHCQRPFRCYEPWVPSASQPRERVQHVQCHTSAMRAAAVSAQVWRAGPKQGGSAAGRWGNTHTSDVNMCGTCRSRDRCADAVCLDERWVPPSPLANRAGSSTSCHAHDVACVCARSEMTQNVCVVCCNVWLPIQYVQRGSWRRACGGKRGAALPVWGWRGGGQRNKKY